LAHSGRLRFPRTRGSSRRRTGWDAGPALARSVVSSAGVTLWPTGAAAAQDGLTIVRIRGEFAINLTVVTSAGDGFASAAIGLCVVTGDAFAAGITAIPTPLADISWDGWMFHQLIAHLTARQTAPLNVAFSALRIPIDTKAMRKIRDTDVLVGVLEMGTEVGNASAQVSGVTRALVKLP